MAYPTVAQIQTRYAYLCDDPLQSTFNNAYFQQAFNEAFDVLWQAFFTAQATRIELMVDVPFPPMTTEFTPAQAGITDFGGQIFLREKPWGSSDQYTDISQVDVLSQRPMTDKLIEVNWRNNTWYFIGSTNLIDLQIKYESSQTAPDSSTDAGLDTLVMVDNCATFLSKYAASVSLPLKGRDELGQKYRNEAVGPKFDMGVIGGALYHLIQPLVRQRQLVQVAPHPYTVTRRLGVYRQVPYVGAQQGTTGGGSQNVPVQYSSKTGSVVGSIDGINTIFWVVVGLTQANWYVNGLLQTAGTDYVGMNNQATFLPGSIPQPGSIITVDGFPVYSGQGNFGSAPSQSI